MGNVKIRKILDSLEEAGELYAKLRLSNSNVELWSVNGGKYTVIERVKTRGRNPKVALVERLDGECPDCHGPTVVVWMKSHTKAFRCLRGHRVKGGVKHPVYLF
ncbi:MAG: hypothetical protein ACPLZY_03870 [Candidatus Norongarragalinales archaeon]